MTTPAQKEAALRRKLKRILPESEENDALKLLDEFIKAYKLRYKIKKADGFAEEVWLRIRYAKVIVPGLILDYKVNKRTGKRLFSIYYKWPLFTTTLKNVKKKTPPESSYYKLADEICVVLNFYDKNGHC